MAKPTTIRIPEDLLNEINEFVQESKLDRSAYLQEVLRKGFSIDTQDRLLLKYVRKELSPRSPSMKAASDTAFRCPLVPSFLKPCHKKQEVHRQENSKLKIQNSKLRLAALKRSSSTITSCPAPFNCLTTCDPIYPAPPTTRKAIMHSQLIPVYLP